MKDGLDQRFKGQGHHGLGNPVGYRGHAENPNTPSFLGNFYRLDRRRKIAARGQPVPEFVQGIIEVLFELPETLAIDACGAVVGFDALIRLIYQVLRNDLGFRLIYQFLPLRLTVNSVLR